MTLQKDLLEEHLDQWKAAGLIDDQQWAEITKYERQHGPGMELPTRRVPVIAEALGYLGAALAAAAVMFFAINQWKEWSDVTRVVVLGTATLAAFAAGWATRTSEEPAIRRFSNVLLTLTVGGTVATTVLLCNDVLDMRDSYGAQTAGGVGLAQLDLDIFALADVADFGEAQAVEGMSDGLALRVEHAVLKGYVDSGFHGGFQLASCWRFFYCSVVGPRTSPGP